MSIQLIKEVLQPGVDEFPQPGGRVSYSFKLNVATGALDVIRNAGGSEVVMADLSIIKIEDPQAVLWSDKLINFSWSTTNPGHMNCEIV